MTHRTYFDYNTPIGHFTIESDGSCITRCFFGIPKLNGERKPVQLTNQAANELQEYLAGTRRVFTVPRAVAASSFREQVAQAALAIPYGQMRTYAQVAASVGASAQAVARAARASELWVFVPMHRLVTQDIIEHPNAKRDLAAYLRHIEALHA